VRWAGEGGAKRLAVIAGRTGAWKKRLSKPEAARSARLEGVLSGGVDDDQS
jgi:hypothetical protein